MIRSSQMKDHILVIRAFLISKGWNGDRFGHLKKKRQVSTDDGLEWREYRMKFGKASLRYEVKCGDRWLRLRSAPYGKVRIENDKLHGLRG